MGRKPGEPLVRLVDVEVVSVRRELLRGITKPGELTREGFPELERPGGADEFVRRYFTPQGLTQLDEITRLEWRYLDGEITHGV